MLEMVVLGLGLRSLGFARDDDNSARDDGCLARGDRNDVRNDGDVIPGSVCVAPMGLCWFRQRLNSLDAPLLWKTRSGSFSRLLSEAAVDVGADEWHRGLAENEPRQTRLTVRICLLNRLRRLSWLGIMLLPDWAVWLALLAWLAGAGGSGRLGGDHG